MTLRKNKPVSADIRQEIDDYMSVSGDNSYLSSFDWHDFYQSWSMSGKWYDHEDNMKEVSEKFPDVVFKLEGLGEDQDRTWCTYYWNGQSRDAVVTVTYSECPW